MFLKEASDPQITQIFTDAECLSPICENLHNLWMVPLNSVPSCLRGESLVNACDQP